MGESATAQAIVGNTRDASSRTNAPSLRTYVTAGEYTPKNTFALCDATHGMEVTKKCFEPSESLTACSLLPRLASLWVKM